MTQTKLKFSQVLPHLPAMLRAQITPALMGDPGIGKSSLINDLARVLKTKVFTLAVNQLADRADLTGARVVEGKDTGNYRQEFFPHATIMNAMEYAEAHPNETPILFMDEFNRASVDITSAVLSFHTERGVGSYKFPDNLRLIVAGNDEGHVTSLDEASISRFALLKVMPDVDTFLEVQPRLNAFVKEVLRKHPEDLTAAYQEGTSNVSSSDTDDDDGQSFEQRDYLMAGLGGENAFQQITRPRTITAVSDWMHETGLDKSGSDKEKEVLGELLGDITEDEQQNTLMAIIQGFVGQTSFAFHLYDEINNHFNNMISTQAVSTAPILDNLRPEQDVINKLSHMSDVSDAEALVQDMGETESIDAMVWLLETPSVNEVNNNRAVEHFVMTSAMQLQDPSSPEAQKAISSIINILSTPGATSQLSIKAMQKAQTPVTQNWTQLLGHMLDQE